VQPGLAMKASPEGKGEGEGEDNEGKGYEESGEDSGRGITLWKESKG
jgi:hypothetical protein